MFPPQAVFAEPEDQLCDLLEAVAAGDRGAFRVLYDKSVSALYPICLRLMRDRELAQDILQEAMVRIWQKAHLFDRSKGSAMAWMAVLTRNCALSRLAVKAPLILSLDDEAVLAAVESNNGSDPVLASDIRHCLKKLNEKYRKCVILIHLQGLSYDELASLMDAPLGTVKVWVYRAMRELSACIGV
jgi:RNA polymerase sigma-70 factor (ECF subfamily)